MARKRQVALLIAAWFVFVGSLPAPATDPLIPFPPLLVLGYVPVLFVFLAPFFSPVSVLASFAAPTLVAEVLFLLSPIAFLGAQTPRRRLAQRVIAVGLLGAWELPLLVDFIADAQQKSQWGIEHVLWGYYLFATAHTIAFAAIQLGDTRAGVDRRRGFEVVSPASDGQQSERSAGGQKVGQSR